MRATKITREMVARHAGVCKQTVSCYLNKTRGVSKDAAERIERAIKELNYVPNMIARGLSQKRTMSLAVICDDLGNPNYSEIISGIQKEANSKSYSILIFDISNNRDDVVNQIIARRVDGVILLTFKDKIGSENIQKLDDNNIKIVVTHSPGEISDKYMQLEPDFYSGLEETLLLLQKLGHQDIVMMSYFDLQDTYDTRLRIFVECYEKIFHRKARYFVDEEKNGATLESGKRLIKKLLLEKDLPTVILTTNDLMAIGMLKYLTKKHRAGEFSIIGFDNMLFDDYVFPSLSSIGYDKNIYGKKLVKMFLSSYAGEEARVDYVGTKLFQRESIYDIHTDPV